MEGTIRNSARCIRSRTLRINLLANQKIEKEKLMKKFLVLYSSTKSANELMADASPEEMKASMAKWEKWREKASEKFKVEFGMPLQPVSKVKSDGVVDSTSKVSGYSIIEGATSAAVVALVRNHPHLERTGSSIEVLEMVSMPGM